MGQEVALVVVSELHSMEAEKTLPVAVADEVLISAGAGVGAGVGAVVDIWLAILYPLTYRYLFNR